MPKLTILSAALAAAALVTAPAKADDTVKNIAGIVALGVLGAAIAEHQHDEGYKNYRPHPGLHDDENAIGACMHYGMRLVRKLGGYDFELERIRDIKRSGDKTVVVFVGTGYYPQGEKTSRVACQVRDGQVRAFNYT